MQEKDISKKVNFICRVGRGSSFGCVWKCEYHKHIYAVKMMVLDTGAHYRRDTEQYYSPFETSQDKLREIFCHNDKKPFCHKDFRNKKGVPTNRFMDEVHNLEHINQLDSTMAPKLKKFWIDKRYQVHYGFIMMSYIPMTFHDLDLMRPITSNETDTVQKKIDILHIKYHIAHGDLKHANVGIKLDSKTHKIKEVCFLDWFSAKFDCSNVIGETLHHG
jgi:hypothetical protein